MQVSNNVKVGGMVFGGTLVGALLGYGVRMVKAHRREKELEEGIENFVKSQDALRSSDMAAHAKVVQELSEKLDLNRDLVDEQKQLNKQLQAKAKAAEEGRAKAEVVAENLAAELASATRESYSKGLKDGTAAALAPDPEPLVGKKPHKRHTAQAEPETLPEAG